MGLIITGDFDGDGKTEKAKLVKVKSGYGNPIEDGVSDEYEIQFSNKKMKPIKIGCCEATLINEGNLNNNDKDAISIFQAPMNGCTYSMQTYTYNNGKWEKVLDPFLVPTACESYSEDRLQNLVIKENNAIYYFTIDPNDGFLIKHKK